MIQKAMLTGAMCAIAPGSPVQLLVAMLVCLAYLVAIVFAGPYKGRLEDQIAFLTSLALTLSLILGFALITDADTPGETAVFDVDTIGWILIGINVLPFVYLVVAVGLVCRYGPNVGIQCQGAATATGRGDAASAAGVVDVDGGKEPLRGRSISRRLTLSHIKQAVVQEKLAVFEKRHFEQHAASLAAIREREKQADARVKKRLAERKARREAREKAGKISKTAVAPVKKQMR